MGNRKYSEFNKRSLTKSGSGSYSVTVPINLLQELKWREGQTLKVRRQGKKLIIEDA